MEERGGRPEDKENFASLVQELRIAMNMRAKEQPFLLTLAVAASPSGWAGGCGVQGEGTFAGCLKPAVELLDLQTGCCRPRGTFNLLLTCLRRESCSQAARGLMQP